MSVVLYKCPNCGASLEFGAESQHFECEFCLSSFTKEDIDQKFSQNEEMDLDKKVIEEKATEEFSKYNNLYTCPSCGAEIISDENTSASFCYYCHGPVILSGRLSGEYKPSKVLPFQISKNQAEDLYDKFCKGKKFIPSDFHSSSQRDKILGMYVPFWIADCNVKGTLLGNGTKIRSWSSGDYRYTETSTYNVVRDANMFLERVPHDGSSKIDDKFIQALEPFDYSKLVDFSMSYLSGYVAEKYDVTRDKIEPIVYDRACNAAYELMNNTVVGYSSVSYGTRDFKINQSKWEYMLLPVWIMTYKYKDKMYYFGVNGQSGEVVGLPPLCKPKLFRFAAAIGALVAGIALLGGIFLL